MKYLGQGLKWWVKASDEELHIAYHSLPPEHQLAISLKYSGDLSEWRDMILQEVWGEAGDKYVRERVAEDIYDNVFSKLDKALNGENEE